MGLEGKIALVTGASTGIGAASAIALAREMGIEHVLGRRPRHLSQGERQRVAISRALVTTIVLAITALVGGAVLGWWTSGTITRPVSRLVEVAQRITAGDLKVRAEVHTQSEIGVLAQAFDEMAARLRELIGNLELQVDELQQAKAHLELLHNLSQSLSQSLDLHDVAQRALDGICAVVGGRHGTVLVLKPGSDHLQLVAISGRDQAAVEAIDQSLHLRLGEGLSGWVAAQGQPALVDDTTRDTRWKPVPGLDEWVRSAMSVPLITREKLVGVLNVYSDQVASFRKHHRQLAESVAAVVAVALSNARMYAEAQEQARKLGLALAHPLLILLGEAFSRLDETAQKVMQALAVYGRPVPPAAVDYLLRRRNWTVSRTSSSRTSLTSCVLLWLSSGGTPRCSMPAS